MLDNLNHIRKHACLMSCGKDVAKMLDQCMQVSCKAAYPALHSGYGRVCDDAIVHR